MITNVSLKNVHECEPHNLFCHEPSISRFCSSKQGHRRISVKPAISRFKFISSSLKASCVITLAVIKGEKVSAALFKGEKDTLRFSFVKISTVSLFYKQEATLKRLSACSRLFPFGQSEIFTAFRRKERNFPVWHEVLSHAHPTFVTWCSWSEAPDFLSIGHWYEYG